MLARPRLSLPLSLCAFVLSLSRPPRGCPAVWKVWGHVESSSSRRVSGCRTWLTPLLAFHLSFPLPHHSFFPPLLSFLPLCFLTLHFSSHPNFFLFLFGLLLFYFSHSIVSVFVHFFLSLPSLELPFLFFFLKYLSSFLSLLFIPFSVLFLVFLYLQISFCFIPLFSLCFLHSLFLGLIFFICNDLHFLMLMSLLFPALRLFLKHDEVKPLLFCPLYSFSDSVEFEFICELWFQCLSAASPPALCPGRGRRRLGALISALVLLVLVRKAEPGAALKEHAAFLLLTEGKLLTRSVPHEQKYLDGETCSLMSALRWVWYRPLTFGSETSDRSLNWCLNFDLSGQRAGDSWAARICLVGFSCC